MKKRILQFFLVGTVVLLSGALIVRSSISGYTVPNDLDDYSFEVAEGEGVRQVVSRLENAGFIQNANMLLMYLKFDDGLAKTIQAGTYTIEPGLNAIEVLNSLQGGVVQERLTFLEGWRREEFASYLAEKKGIEFATEFYQKTDGLEGTLFPDTYFIDATTTVEGLIEKMHKNYEAKTAEIFSQNKSRLSLEDALILASIVQREAVDPVDQSLIAGILLKRVNNGWPLESDVTVQYALADEMVSNIGGVAAIANPEFDWWPAIETRLDLDIDSAYNTRKYPGFPPAPISNPGRTALEAVANPTPSVYWYFIADAQGIVRYATTLTEHNQNIATFGLVE